VSRKNRSRKKDEQQQPAAVPQVVDAVTPEETVVVDVDVDVNADVDDGGEAAATADAVAEVEVAAADADAGAVEAEAAEVVEAEVTEIVEVDVVAGESLDDDAADDDAAVEAFAGDGAGFEGDGHAHVDVAPVDASEAQLAVRDTASYDHLKPIIEALIFASPEPLTPKTLFKLLESEPKEDVETALALLKQDYDHPGGLQLVEVAGGYQIVTRPELHEYVRRLFHERTSQKLSVQALETLAVIAYRQPVTAPEITEIRGVNTSGVLNTLVDRKLVKIVGRKDVVGRPFMYATTRDFLDKFGLNDISDLPKVEDLADVLGFEPPSLDSGEPEATSLAFDFGDPVESSASEALAPEADESSETAASAEPSETLESSEAFEPTEAHAAGAAAHAARDTDDTHDADEAIAPVADASSESAQAVSSDAVHDEPSESAPPRDEDEYL
jgi:segregation and condensation protein B